MPTPAELEKHFWKSLDSDRTVFLSCDGAKPRPMTAIAENESAPIWFFTSSDTDLAQALNEKAKVGHMTFASKGHDVWCSASGTLVIDNDREVIDRLWNPFIAAWYEDGKDDPKLTLVRYDATDAHVWENANSLVAGIKMLMGSDPKEDFESQTADVRLDD